MHFSYKRITLSNGISIQLCHNNFNMVSRALGFWILLSNKTKLSTLLFFHTLIEDFRFFNAIWIVIVFYHCAFFIHYSSCLTPTIHNSHLFECTIHHIFCDDDPITRLTTRDRPIPEVVWLSFTTHILMCLHNLHMFLTRKIHMLPCCVTFVVYFSQLSRLPLLCPFGGFNRPLLYILLVSWLIFIVGISIYHNIDGKLHRKPPNGKRKGKCCHLQAPSYQKKHFILGLFS